MDRVHPGPSLHGKRSIIFDGPKKSPKQSTRQICDGPVRVNLHEAAESATLPQDLMSQIRQGRDGAQSLRSPRYVPSSGTTLWAPIYRPQHPDWWDNLGQEEKRQIWDRVKETPEHTEAPPLFAPPSAKRFSIFYRDYDPRTSTEDDDELLSWGLTSQRKPIKRGRRIHAIPGPVQASSVREATSDGDECTTRN